MKTIGYSYIETHKIEHDFFIAQLEKIYFEIEMEDTESIFQILDFLRKWLENHVKESDKKLVGYI
jgi:hemerythrin